MNDMQQQVFRGLKDMAEELERLREIEEAARETLNTLEAWSLADGGLHVSAAEELAERRDDLRTALDAERGGDVSEQRQADREREARIRERDDQIGGWITADEHAVIYNAILRSEGEQYADEVQSRICETEDDLRWAMDYLSDTLQDLGDLLARVERYREALEFYAHPGSYSVNRRPDTGEMTVAVMDDDGRRAREVLGTTEFWESDAHRALNDGEDDG